LHAEILWFERLESAEYDSMAMQKQKGSRKALQKEMEMG
jgi:hypothetical protein